MAITSVDSYIASAKQKVPLSKFGQRTSVAGVYFSTFDLIGNPSGGVLAGTSTTTGVVPTDATVGYPLIDAFGGTNTGYLSSIQFGNTVPCRMIVADNLWKGGAYAFNAVVTGQVPTSYASRIPTSGGYSTTEIWFEAVTAFTGNLNLSVTYINQSGTGGRTTGSLVFSFAPTVGRMFKLPLAAGDVGVQGITGVSATGSTAGTFNIHILRPLYTNMRCGVANDGRIDSWDKTGGVQVYADSALVLLINADSTATGIPDVLLEIANG